MYVLVCTEYKYYIKGPELPTRLHQPDLIHGGLQSRNSI